MAERVLVTGAAGFVGRATVAALTAAGHEVVGTFRGTEPAPGPAVIWDRCDLTGRGDVAALMARHRPTALLTLAWHMGPGNMQAVENYRWVGHTVETILAFAEHGGRRVLACGSCAEYDWTGSAPLSEAAPLRPASDYGIAKAATWGLFAPLCARLGLSGVWARPFFLYGPGENPRRLVADVIVSLLAGRAARCSSGTQRRDFLHVDDLARALVALLDSPLTGAVNIGSGQAMALADLVAEIGRQTGRADLIRLGALPDRPGEAALVAADVTRLRTETGWRPRFDLATGIADTIGWWRAHPPTEGATA